MTILNLTQHAGTPEQGVIEPAAKAEVCRLLTFEFPPTEEEITGRAEMLANLAVREIGDGKNWTPRETWEKRAMIGGAPFLMAPLERALVRRGILPVFAFSVRESVETVASDGSVRKTAIFRHLGFVPVAGLPVDDGE